MQMEDLAVLTPLLVAIGGAVGWWVRRSERREAQLIEFYKARAVDAEKERDEWERRATAWHQQLLDNGIRPDPQWGAKT